VAKRKKRKPTVEEIWAQVPSVDCDGRCAKACRVIGMSEEEFMMMEDRIPDFPSFEQMMFDQKRVGPSNYRCPSLVDGRCSQYDVRPLVCRLYGVTEAMKCPFGCVPEGGFMPAEEASRLWDRMTEVGGPSV
jgi:hypothetical protein